MVCVTLTLSFGGVFGGSNTVESFPNSQQTKFLGMNIPSSLNTSWVGSVGQSTDDGLFQAPEQAHHQWMHVAAGYRCWHPPGWLLGASRLPWPSWARLRRTRRARAPH